MFKSSKGKDKIGKRTEVSSSSQVGQSIGGGGATAVVPGIVATGGTKTIDQGYAYHLFTSPGTFAVTAFNPNPFSVEFINVLIVGGGGAGGDDRGGGGGAGAFRLENQVAVTNPYSVPVSIGAGGAGVSGNMGNNGTQSSFGPLIAPGGGGGSGNATTPGREGGSAGGGTGNSNTYGGTPNQPFLGNAGGRGLDNAGSYGGGGGGAVGAGGGAYVGPVGPYDGTTAGNGGAGRNFALIPTDFGDNGYFAGGGGGGSSQMNTGPQPESFGLGGQGGGGRGGARNTPQINGSTATANTGGGGGGGADNGSGAAGGSGVVIVFYQV